MKTWHAHLRRTVKLIEFTYEDWNKGLLGFFGLFFFFFLLFVGLVCFFFNCKRKNKKRM